MSGLAEINPNGNFSIEKYQTRYTNKTVAIQVALGIIAVSGITLAVLSHYGCVDHVFMYVGTGGAIASALTALGVFIFGKKNNLRVALSDVRSVDDLRQVWQNLEFHETNCLDYAVWMGADCYLNVSSKDFSGTIHTRNLTDKIDWLIRNKEHLHILEADVKYLQELRTSITDRMD